MPTIVETRFQPKQQHGLTPKFDFFKNSAKTPTNIIIAQSNANQRHELLVVFS
jgi:hypothetical protein